MEEQYYCIQVKTLFKPNRNYETGKMAEDDGGAKNRLIGYAEYYQVLGAITLMAEQFIKDHSGKIVSMDNYSADDWMEYGRGEINIEIDMPDLDFTRPTQEEKEEYRQFWANLFHRWHLYMGTDEEVQDEQDDEEAEQAYEQFATYYGLYREDLWPSRPTDSELI